jgi:hypothetical protein
VASCQTCNAKKGDRTPEQAGMHLRKRPNRPEWKPLYSTGRTRVASWSHFLPDDHHEPSPMTALVSA